MRKIVLAIAASAVYFAAAAQSEPEQTVKIASLDMMSGSMAGLGLNVLKGFQHSVQLANQDGWAGRVKLQIVPFDNKYSPQEALTILNIIIGQDIRYVVQGASSSAVGVALMEAIERHNTRNPGKEIVYLNYASQAPVMTNAKCSYWHFRFDANSDMKVDSMTTYLARQSSIKKIYQINPNYSYGQDVAKATRETLARKRPEVQVVGEDFLPTGQVKDFAPYAAKIRQSGADAVVTAGAGQDLSLLVRAMRDAGLNIDLYTLNANTYGVPAAVGAAGEGRVKLVSTFSPNDPRFKGGKVIDSFKEKFNEDFINGAGHNAIVALSQAIREARSTDPIAVAARLEGMKFEGLNGPVELRRDDHQAQQQVFVTSWKKVDGKRVVHDQDATGFGWMPVDTVNAADAVLPTSCVMKRPAAKANRS